MTNICTMTNWDENVVSGGEDAPRFAHAHVAFEYTGVIEGTSVCDYLLYYAGAGYDGTGQTAPGFERVEGSVDGRKGTFILRHEVGYDAQGIQGTFIVVPGSGTDELAGLTGSGTATGAMGEAAVSYTFDYSLG